MKQDPILGIDLGTTNSLAAIFDEDGSRIVEGKDGRAIVPSVVAIMENGAIVVGEAALALAYEQPERVIHSVKRLMGRSLSEVRVEASRLAYQIVEGPDEQARIRIPLDGKDGRPSYRDYSPEEISSLILREVHQRAVATLDGAGLTKIVLTVPAYFDDAQRQSTRQAAELAGLRVLRLVNEPTAASLAYGDLERRQGRILVYDLGGGTFDVSILKISETGTFRVLATHGDTQLGGDDFDRAVLDRILAAIEETHAATPTDNRKLLATLRRSAEGIKIRLSHEKTAKLEIQVGSSERFAFTLSRIEFEELIDGYVAQTLSSVAAALRDAELEAKDIDAVVLVGGSTRIPLVRRRMEEFFGKKPLTSLDPDYAIALGAATQAAVLAGKEENILLMDVIPLALGIETIGGAFSKLILRNSAVPCSVTEEFTTSVDNQTGIELSIYQGERELVVDCRKIGFLELSGIPPMVAMLPRVAVTFSVDANAMLRVSAREIRTGKTTSAEIQASHGLSSEEVKRIVRDSIEHAAHDMDNREALECRNKAVAVLRGIKAVLASGGSAGLAVEQAYAIKKAIGRLEKALGAEDLPTLKSALDLLSSLTMQVADDMISASVRKELQDVEDV